MSLRSWLHLGASAVLSLALLELALRLWFPLYPSPYQPDDLLLVKLVPGAAKVFVRAPVNGRQRIVSHFNRDGFRGPELRPAGRQRRVLVYGDSNIQAEFSPLPATFAMQLQRRLGERLHQEVEVVNAGVVGYGPDQVSLRLPGEIERYRPDLVVVAVFADNDFGDLIRNRLYRLDAAGNLRRTGVRLEPGLRAELRELSAPTSWRRLQLSRYAIKCWETLGRRAARGRRAAIQRAALAGYVDQSLADNLEVYRRYERGERYAEDPFLDYYDADIALRPDLPSSRAKVALMEKVVARIGATAAARSTPLALLILPSPIDACDHYDMSADPARYPRYDRTRLSGLIEGMADRNGIPCLNLLSEFHGAFANRYYFHGGDDHWNDAGQSQAARLFAELVVRRRLLDRAPGAAGSTPPAPTATMRSPSRSGPLPAGGTGRPT